MRALVLQRVVQLWEGTFSRSELLLAALLMIGGTSWVYGLFLDLPYDPWLNIRLGIFLAFCIPFVYWPACYTLVANLLIASCGVTMFQIAMQTGGINSLPMMWLTAIPVLPLFLIGLRGTAYWFVITLVSIAFMHYLTVSNKVSGGNAHVFEHIPWGYLTVTALTLILMIGIRLYDQIHRLQMRQLEDSNEALRQTHETLIHLQNLRDEFVASVGHELRTPMNAILGFNGVLRDQLAHDPQMLNTVGHIHDATHQLLGLVNDILDFSQLQAGKMQLNIKPCDLVLVLQHACDPWRKVAESKGVRLHFEKPENFPREVMVDEGKFRKLADKLLDNAIKFTNSGAVTVRLAREGDGLKLMVEDTGHGIAADVQGQIFTRFERADLETNRKFGGTGLGLAICKGLVDLMGGHIGFSSQEGQGSRFWVSLSSVDVSTASPRELLQSETLILQADAAFKLLLVDDNKINLMVAQMQLSKAWPRLNIVSCSSAAQALAALEQSAFDIALVDMVMPDMDGLALTRVIRRHAVPEIAQLPIVGFTANVESHERGRCLDAGMNDVLTKPMDEQWMVAVISRCVGTRMTGAVHEIA